MDNEGKVYSFTAKVGRDELFRFHFYSVYCNMQGVIAIILSVLMAVICVMSWGKINPGLSVLLIIAAVYYPVYKPIAILAKSAIQSKNEAFVNGIGYTADKRGVTVKVGEEQARFSWSNVTRLVKRKQEVYLYTGRLFAYIISREQGGEALEGMLGLLADYKPEYDEQEPEEGDAENDI